MTVSFDQKGLTGIARAVEIEKVDIEDATRVYTLLLTQPAILQAGNAMQILSTEIAKPVLPSSVSDWAALNILTFLSSKCANQLTSRESIIYNFAYYIAFAYDITKKMEKGELGVQMP